MLNVIHLRTLIVRPVLEYLDMWSEVAENLVIGTAIQESRLTHLQQLGGGPAVGIYQMEPNTHTDLWNNYIRFRPTLVTKLNNLRVDSPFDGQFLKVPSYEMIGNLYYATAMCRIHYRRAPSPLPPNDVPLIAAYWKKYYNTPLGAGTVQEFIDNYTKFNKYDA